jgi:hypothetical protein
MKNWSKINLLRLGLLKKLEMCLNKRREHLSKMLKQKIKIIFVQMRTKLAKLKEINSKKSDKWLLKAGNRAHLHQKDKKAAFLNQDLWKIIFYWKMNDFIHLIIYLSQCAFAIIRNQLLN